jgi:hypothetical protein
MTERQPLQELCKRLAGERGSSIVILEIRRLDDGSMFCEDVATLRASHPKEVLVARAAALQEMLWIEEQDARVFR